MQSYISNEEDNKDASDNNYSIKHKEADKGLNTKDIDRGAPSNKDQKITSNYNNISEESTNEQAINNCTALSKESRNNTSPSPHCSDILSRLKHKRSSRIKAVPHRYNSLEYQIHLCAATE